MSDLLDDLKEYDLSFPIINGDSQADQYDASAVIQLLLGHDVDLIRWNPDPFEKLWRAESPPIPVYTAGVYGVAEIGIFVMFGGAIGVFADLDFGLSSRGITQDLNHDGRPDGNVLNGFFFGDNRPGARTSRTNSNWE